MKLTPVTAKRLTFNEWETVLIEMELDLYEIQIYRDFARIYPHNFDGNYFHVTDRSIGISTLRQNDTPPDPAWVDKLKTAFERVTAQW